MRGLDRAQGRRKRLDASERARKLAWMRAMAVRLQAQSDDALEGDEAPAWAPRPGDDDLQTWAARLHAEAGAVIDADPQRAARTERLVEQLAGQLALRPADVSVRVDARAARVVERLGASGAAEGRVVHLHPGRFDPETRAGRQLLAHELVHVAQRPGASAAPGAPDAFAAEREAAALAGRFAAGHAITPPRQRLPALAVAADIHADAAERAEGERVPRWTADDQAAVDQLIYAAEKLGYKVVPTAFREEVDRISGARTTYPTHWEIRGGWGLFDEDLPKVVGRAEIGPDLRRRLGQGLGGMTVADDAPSTLRARVLDLERALRAGELPEGRSVETFDGGAVVLWIRNASPYFSTETYRYHPEDRAAYERILGSKFTPKQIALVHDAFVRSNADMRDLVERRLYSPSEAYNYLVELDRNLAIILAFGLGGMAGAAGGPASVAAAASSWGSWAPLAIETLFNTFVSGPDPTKVLPDPHLPHNPQDPDLRPVQRRTRRGADPRAIHEAAAAGLRGAATQLPHLAAVQAAFGRHDVSGIRAHVGGATAQACEAMGASAYASGDAVAFAAPPDLHTAAHEAAHVVQQRAGVTLPGGVGQAGDAYERHADAVAERVVRGESAEPLLDTFVGTGTRSAGPSRAIQREVAPDVGAIEAGLLDRDSDLGTLFGAFDHSDASMRHFDRVHVDSHLTIGLGHFASSTLRSFIADMLADAEAGPALTASLRASFASNDAYWKNLLAHAGMASDTEPSDAAIATGLKATLGSESWAKKFKNTKALREQAPWATADDALRKALREPAVARFQVAYWYKKVVDDAATKAAKVGSGTVGGNAAAASTDSSRVSLDRILAMAKLGVVTSGDGKGLETVDDYQAPSDWVTGYTFYDSKDRYGTNLRLRKPGASEVTISQDMAIANGAPDVEVRGLETFSFKTRNGLKKDEFVRVRHRGQDAVGDLEFWAPRSHLRRASEGEMPTLWDWNRVPEALAPQNGPALDDPDHAERYLQDWRAFIIWVTYWAFLKDDKPRGRNTVIWKRWYEPVWGPAPDDWSKLPERHRFPDETAPENAHLAGLVEGGHMATGRIAMEWAGAAGKADAPPPEKLPQLAPEPAVEPEADEPGVEQASSADDLGRATGSVPASGGGAGARDEGPPSPGHEGESEAAPDLAAAVADFLGEAAAAARDAAGRAERGVSEAAESIRRLWRGDAGIRDGIVRAALGEAERKVREVLGANRDAEGRIATYFREGLGSRKEAGEYCAAFVCWAYTQAGAEIPKRTGSAQGLMEGFLAAGRFIPFDGDEAPQPGDVVFFTRKDVDREVVRALQHDPKALEKRFRCTHVGLYLAPDKNGRIRTVEGNTYAGISEDQHAAATERGDYSSEGVMERSKKVSRVIGFGRAVG